MKFEYVVDLKEGYKPTMEIEPKEELRFFIEAKNRVTADRMVAALLKDASNIKEIFGFCID